MWAWWEVNRERTRTCESARVCRCPSLSLSRHMCIFGCGHACVCMGLCVCVCTRVRVCAELQNQIRPSGNPGVEWGSGVRLFRARFSIEKWTCFCWMRGLDSTETRNYQKIWHRIQSVLWALKLTPVIFFDSQSKFKAEFIIHIFRPLIFLPF